jgi:hypothetical protein
MHATIHRRERGAAMSSELARSGDALATRLRTADDPLARWTQAGQFAGEVVAQKGL